MTLEDVKKLSDEDLRIKVAELYGFSNIRERTLDEVIDWQAAHDTDQYPEELIGSVRGLNMVDVPHFPQDLNAMHEAWKSLSEEDQERFDYTLAEILRQGWPDDKNLTWFCCQITNATARQRAEAFVLTMEKE